MTRLPDFLIIGAMKSATTSLYHWLDAQPGCSMPHASRKEPDFFSRDEVWQRGLPWYSQIFEHVPVGTLTGEASASYTSPDGCGPAAERIATTLPHAPLVYVVRHPVERIRSHYRHEVQRTRERRSLADALRDPDNPYVGYSLYHQRLRPYLDAVGPGRLCVVSFEDLVGDDRAAWQRVLAHVGLPPGDHPTTAYNVTADKPQFTPLLLRIWQRGPMDWTKWLPGPVRKVGRRALTREGDSYTSQLEESFADIPEPVVEALAEDAGRLADDLGLARPFWELSAGAR